MKLTDIITINKAGLDEVTTTVQDHLISFAYSCNVDMQKEWDERKEHSFDLINASTVALKTLSNGNDIEDWLWYVMIDLMEDREWHIVEDEERGELK